MGLSKQDKIKLDKFRDVIYCSYLNRVSDMKTLNYLKSRGVDVSLSTLRYYNLCVISGGLKK